MKNSFKLVLCLSVLLYSCKPDKPQKPYNVTINDGLNTYNYSGDTLNQFSSQAEWYANFSSTSNISSGTGFYYSTRSEFRIKLGNLSRVNLSVIFETSDSAIVTDIKPNKPQQGRLTALQKIIKPGVYKLSGAIVSPFIIYTTEQDKIWIVDLTQQNTLEVISSALNTQDNTANKIIAQVNFDIGLKGSNFTGSKRIRGSIYSYYNL